MTCDNRGRAHFARRCVGQPLCPHKRRAAERRRNRQPTSDDESGAVMRSRRESLHAVCVSRIVAAHAEHGLTAHSAQ
eukprot:4255175-Prymnesium_polylepis.1